MTPETIAAVANISASIVTALRDAHAMTRRGEFGGELNDLVRRARELCDHLMETIGGAGDVGKVVRDYATTLAAGLDDMERLIDNRAPH